MRSLVLLSQIGRLISSDSIKKTLPFPDESFDLVRMACLTMAIPFESWEPLLREVRRVLTVGGRLELIDDHVFFAYGKPPSTTESNPGHTPAPVLDMNFPSPRLSVNPNAQMASTTYDDDMSETATLSGYYERGVSTQQPTIELDSIESQDSWRDSVMASRDLELLFEHLMNMRYGIHLCPSEFVLGMMQQVFGHSREVETMHFTLASPEVAPKPDASADEYGNPNSLLQAPGLVMWPSTFIPLSHSDLEAHALKHNRVLLACKSMLVDYAVQVGAGQDIEDEAVLEALWDYEKYVVIREGSINLADLLQLFDTAIRPTARHRIVPFTSLQR